MDLTATMLTVLRVSCLSVLSSLIDPNHKKKVPPGTRKPTQSRQQQNSPSHQDWPFR